MDYSSKKLSDMTFCALDLETTGTNPAFHDIVEAGIIRFTREGARDSYESLVNPGVRIPPETIAIHGITDEMVQGSPPIGDILGDIAEFITGSLLVIHCPEFDISFLREAFRKNDMPVPEMIAVDTVRLSRRAYPGLPNYRLDTICNHLRCEIMHHRASPDARGCMTIFSDVIRREDPDCRWSLSDLRKYHGDFIRMTGGKRMKRVSAKGKKIRGIELGGVVDITYMDNAGNVTTRKIQPREFITVGEEVYVLAYCFLRGENRYFKMDRILEPR
jgi:DNA polymerase III subunit epsilon